VGIPEELGSTTVLFKSPEVMNGPKRVVKIALVVDDKPALCVVAELPPDWVVAPVPRPAVVAPFESPVVNCEEPVVAPKFPEVNAARVVKKPVETTGALISTSQNGPWNSSVHWQEQAEMLATPLFEHKIEHLHEHDTGSTTIPSLMFEHLA